MIAFIIWNQNVINAFQEKLSGKTSVKMAAVMEHGLYGKDVTPLNFNKQTLKLVFKYKVFQYQHSSNYVATQ